MNNICVYADTKKAKPVAIIFPVENVLKELASENGIKGEHLEEMVHDEKLNDIVLKKIQEAGKKAGLSGIELVDGVVMAEEEWTPQNVSCTGREAGKSEKC